MKLNVIGGWLPSLTFTLGFVNATTKITPFIFIALCIAAPFVQLLEFYGLYHWEDGVVAGLLIVRVHGVVRQNAPGT